MTEVLDLSKKNSKRLYKTHADYYLDLRDLNKEFKEDFESLELKKRKIDSEFRKSIYASIGRENVKTWLNHLKLKRLRGELAEVNPVIVDMATVLDLDENVTRQLYSLIVSSAHKKSAKSNRESLAKMKSILGEENSENWNNYLKSKRTRR